MLSNCSLVTLPYHADPGFWFQAIHREPGAVLLDSGRPVATRGRFDILSAWPVEVFQPDDGESGSAFFHRLRRSLAALGRAGFPDGTDLPFAGGLLGYLSYDFGRRLEALPSVAEDDLQLPEARLGLYDWALITDHQTQQSWLVFHPHCPDPKRTTITNLLRGRRVKELGCDTQHT